MYKSENEQKNQITSINRYNNFGLREKDSYLWVSTLVDMGDSFFPWTNNHPLGRKMVEAASAWFLQSELITSKARKPTKLVSLFERNGGDFSVGWEFIWAALSNNSIIIKWLITHTDIGVSYSTERIADMLRADYPELSEATIKGGLAALKDMISKSPVGGEDSFIQYETKGKSVISIKRLAKKIHPLSLLYGLYLIARLSDSSTFTVTGLMDSDMNSSYISPIVSFGISSTDFKNACNGLHSRYPDYIDTTFTYGNDELRVYPDRFSTADIIDLAIKEV